jgi:hypothetical protein
MSNIPNLLPQFSLNDFIRNIYPGLIIASFLFYWKPMVRTIIGQDQVSISLFFLVLVIISGFLFMGLYRGVFVFLLRFVEKNFGYFPQYNFHKQVMKEQLTQKQIYPEIQKEIQPKLEDLNLISACATRILIEKDKGIFRNELAFGNGQVHLIYSALIFSVFGMIFSIFAFGIGVFALIFMMLSIFLFFGGIKFNHLMDMRETLFLIEKKEDYSNLLGLYIDSIIKK